MELNADNCVELYPGIFPRDALKRGDIVNPRHLAYGDIVCYNNFRQNFGDMCVIEAGKLGVVCRRPFVKMDGGVDYEDCFFDIEAKTQLKLLFVKRDYA